jgi:hypothetical protein
MAPGDSFMDAQELLTLIHVILFAYWLGGDIGVFYSSGLVVDDSLERSARLAAGRIMLAVDLIPRICMSLMLTVGGLLSATLGVEHPPWQMAGIVLLGPFWLGMVLILHFRHHASFIPMLTRFDFWFRWAMIAALLLSSGWSLATGRLEEAPWLIAKLLGFAFLVFCGLMIRVRLKGFVDAYVKLAQGSETAEDNRRMQASLSRVRPWVLSIWVVLVVEAWLGIAQPGAAAGAHLDASAADIVTARVSAI